MAFTTLHSSSNCRRPFTTGSSSRRGQPHACRFRPLCKPLGAAADDNSSNASSTPRLESQPDAQHTYSRRQHLLAALASAAAVAASSLAAPRPAAAFTQPPEGFSLHLDKLDGYQFFYPELWTGVTSSGNDIFLRNPFNVEQCLFVDISSPSSSRYDSVASLGTPEEAAKRLLNQYLNQEFMSTRIGIRREGKILSASSRTGDDGREYYDIAIQMTSYASRNPYVATYGEVMKDYGLEWDRRLVTTLGVANSRLYELRMQANNEGYDSNADLYGTVQRSFKVKEVEV